jgi:hypothetical protein
MGIELEVIPCGCYDPHSTIKRLASNLKVITTEQNMCIGHTHFPFGGSVQTAKRMQQTYSLRLLFQFSRCFAAIPINVCIVNTYELLWMRFYASVPQKLSKHGLRVSLGCSYKTFPVLTTAAGLGFTLQGCPEILVAFFTVLFVFIN